MKSETVPPLPLETADVARSVFNIKNVYLSIGDQSEQLFSDMNLADLGNTGEKRSCALWLMAMVTIFQLVEDLPDRLAAEAIRKRTDWKYALHLSLDYPGFNSKVLCEFRQRLRLNKDGQRVFECMLSRLANVGLLNRRIEDWTDATYVLQAVCTLSRVDQLVQAMNQTLEALAAYRPELLRLVTLPHWYDRYYPLSTTINLPRSPQGQAALVQGIGKDTLYLIETIKSSDVLDLDQLPEFKSLVQTWHQQFEQQGSEILWRDSCSFCRKTTSLSRPRQSTD